ncbi:hypothetical protein EHS25_005575 [Saitozyma podzolica]|uniref:Uncharacterized protein n=1 Tax=Saitozyma podzolica TaxID=1890683 RepID=A0A427XXX9_9TREE|nr:hypothetical protein EHS25_005575 [Saitozyma podzolica]
MLPASHSSTEQWATLSSSYLDATVAWLEPTDNRAHNRVVSTGAAYGEASAQDAGAQLSAGLSARFSLREAGDAVFHHMLELITTPLEGYDSSPICGLQTWIKNSIIAGPNRTRLRPAAGDLLTTDPHLPEMMRYVQHLVEGPEAGVAARNAALAYLALITAFAEKGLLQIDWAPRLLIEVGNREFGINLDGPEDLNPVSMTLAPPSGSPVDIERGRDSPDPARPSKF